MHTPYCGAVATSILEPFSRFGIIARFRHNPYMACAPLSLTQTPCLECETEELVIETKAEWVPGAKTETEVDGKVHVTQAAGQALNVAQTELAAASMADENAAVVLALLA